MPDYQAQTQLTIFTPRNIFNFLAACFCFLVGWLYIIYPWFISFGLFLGILATFLFLAYPLLGLYLFLAVVYLRPQDYYPVLAFMNLTRSVAIIMLVAFATKMFLTRQPFVKAKQNNYLLWFTILMVVSSGLSGWPANSFTHWVDFTKVALTYFVIVNLVDTPLKLKAIIWFFVLINFFVAGTYVWQYLTGYGYAFGRLMGLTQGFLGNADEIAITFIVSLPLAIALYLLSKNLFVKAFLGLGTIFLFFSTILTKSRGALLSVFAVIFMMLFMYRQRLKKIPLYQIILFCLVALFMLYRLRLTILGLLTKTTDFNDPAVVGRFDAWRSARRMIQSHPLLGVGRGNFISYWEAHFPVGSWGQRQIAHNIVMQVASETGLLGLALYLLYSFQALRDWIKHLAKWECKNETEEYFINITRCLIVSILGFYCGGMFITVGFYWHLYLLVAFFVAAERNLWNSHKVIEWQ